MLTIIEPTIDQLSLAKDILHKLGIPVHRVGYKHLCIAIPHFAEDDMQSLTKELYPYIAESLGSSDWHTIEHSIRVVILDAWERRDSEIWENYFPNSRRSPSNNLFIATLAELIK